MASFNAKIGWKRPKKRENTKLSFRSILTRGMLENSKKMAKKFKKLKNIIVASFQAKIGLKRLGRRDNKKYSSVSFLSDA